MLPHILSHTLPHTRVHALCRASGSTLGGRQAAVSRGGAASHDALGQVCAAVLEVMEAADPTKPRWEKLAEKKAKQAKAV